MARKNRYRTFKSRKNKNADHVAGENFAENDLSSAPLEKAPVLIDKKELRDAALERAKNRPIRERIMAFSGGKKITIIKNSS